MALSPNFTLLISSPPDVARLVAAMAQARDAVERRSWSHPLEHVSEEWWADVLANPRARKRERRTDLAKSVLGRRSAEFATQAHELHIHPW
jgi:hypothetical protein